MNCHQARQIIDHEYLSQSGARFSDETQGHLLVCEACREYRLQITAVFRDFQRDPLTAPPTVLVHSIRSRIYRNRQAFPNAKRNLFVLAGVTAILLLILFVWGIERNRGPRDSKTAQHKNSSQTTTTQKEKETTLALMDTEPTPLTPDQTQKTDQTQNNFDEISQKLSEEFGTKKKKVLPLNQTHKSSNIEKNPTTEPPLEKPRRPVKSMEEIVEGFEKDLNDKLSKNTPLKKELQDTGLSPVQNTKTNDADQLELPNPEAFAIQQKAPDNNIDQNIQDAPGPVFENNAVTLKPPNKDISPASTDKPNQKPISVSSLEPLSKSTKNETKLPVSESLDATDKTPIFPNTANHQQTPLPTSDAFVEMSDLSQNLDWQTFEKSLEERTMHTFVNLADQKKPDLFFENNPDQQQVPQSKLFPQDSSANHGESNQANLYPEPTGQGIQNQSGVKKDLTAVLPPVRMISTPLLRMNKPFEPFSDLSALEHPCNAPCSLTTNEGPFLANFSQEGFVLLSETKQNLAVAQLADNNALLKRLLASAWPGEYGWVSLETDRSTTQISHGPVPNALNSLSRPSLGTTDPSQQTWKKTGNANSEISSDARKQADRTRLTNMVYHLDEDLPSTITTDTSTQQTMPANGLPALQMSQHQTSSELLPLLPSKYDLGYCPLTPNP